MDSKSLTAIDADAAINRARAAMDQLCHIQAIVAGAAALLELAQPVDKSSGRRVCHADTLLGFVDGLFSPMSEDMELFEALALAEARRAQEAQP